MRRLTLSIVLVAAGFAAGVVATGRGRAAEVFRAPESPRPIADAAPAQRPGAVAPAPAAPEPVPQPMGMGGGPDFTRIAGQAVKGVANISSLQVVRTRYSPFANDPFFRYFFGDDDAGPTRDRR